VNNSWLSCKAFFSLLIYFGIGGDRDKTDINTMAMGIGSILLLQNGD